MTRIAAFHPLSHRLGVTSRRTFLYAVMAASAVVPMAYFRRRGWLK